MNESNQIDGWASVAVLAYIGVGIVAAPVSALAAVGVAAAGIGAASLALNHHDDIESAKAENQKLKQEKARLLKKNEE